LKPKSPKKHGAKDLAQAQKQKAKRGKKKGKAASRKTPSWNKKKERHPVFKRILCQEKRNIGHGKETRKVGKNHKRSDRPKKIPKDTPK